MTEYQKEELTDYHILKTIENDASVSQRRLSSQMELNVASVNFALKRLIKKGFIRMVGANPRRIKYYITPEGLREKTQLAYSFFGRNFHFYKEVRNDIETKIIRATNGSKTKIAICGVNELAEIAYMVVTVMRWEFAGFFIGDSKITNKKLFGHMTQKLEDIKKVHPCLLLLTDELSDDMLSDSDLKNIDTLNLLNYYK
ncbi:MAG: transcriptional regulator protein [Candidatus Scalindua rubra]|uniref:Transcriptional regulator protein n=1 Tax=Candidatus Scalindua rubra TaxID=1872076 RepID=A0A1E3XAW7_9BACT|nr:MAG: transcriptional regulator protein [Candidatus Scalindua rubra]